MPTYSYTLTGTGKLPKWEGRITIPASTQITITEVPAATAAVTITAGDYYLTSATALLSTIGTLLTANGTLVGTYTMTLDDDTDSAPGKVTLTATGITSFTIAWTSTTLRDYLGFSGSETGTLSYVGAKQARYLWLPNVGPTSQSAPTPSVGTTDFGARETDLTVAVAPSGSSARLKYNTRIVNEVGFNQVLGKKTWISLEDTINESQERFYADVIGEGVPFRWVRNRDVDTIYWTYITENGQTYKPAPVVPGWLDSATSLWSMGWTLRKLVE